MASKLSNQHWFGSPQESQEMIQRSRSKEEETAAMCLELQAKMEKARWDMADTRVTLASYVEEKERLKQLVKEKHDIIAQ